MSPPTVRMVCPRCGTPLAAVLAPLPPTQWFPCPHCGTPVPVVVPRDPPPLYAWEVLPGLYPGLPPPRPTRRLARPAVAVALSIVAIVSVVLVGFLTAYGVEANSPAHYSVNGVVERASGGGWVAASGAEVVLTEENGTAVRNWTGPSGTFFFGNVPSGGVTLNVTLAGYPAVTVDTFVSPVYDAGTTGLTIQLPSGNPTNGTTYVLSPFPDLETLIASIGAGAVLLGLIAAVAAGAAVLTRRRDRVPLGVVGGGAGAAAPVTLYLLSLTVVFPTLELVAALAGAFGAFVVAVTAFELARTGAPVRSA